jgi:phosphopantetheine adenylyltransferase
MAPTPQPALSLLLLPALHLPSPPSSLRSAYKTTFETLLPKLIQPGSSTIARLDIALVLSPSYPISPNISRSATYLLLQTLLSQTYSLVCSIAAESNIDLDFPGGLDVRMFLLEARTDSLPQSLLGKQPLSGPIIDLHTFISSTPSRPYTSLYSVEGETGESHLKALITAWQSRQGGIAPPIHRLPCGPSLTTPSSSATPYAEDGPVATHTSVAVGGTFDHLHIGHKLLLTATVLAAEPSDVSSPSSPKKTPRLITVGITGDELLVNKKYGSVVESWSTRQQRTADFVESILVFHPDIPSITKTESIDEPGPNGKLTRVTYGDDITINYTQISDPFGPTITDENITALVISGETRAGGKAVNDKRREKGWKELQVFEVDVLDAAAGLDAAEGQQQGEKQSFESKISSTEIRRRLQEREAGASAS